jgi:hypothetical protein
MLGSSSIISIGRGHRFSPTDFFGGRGWKIVEQDERSLALAEIDFSKVLFETMLKEGEATIKGEEKLNRLKASNHVRLDAKVFQTLWNNQHLIPESWKERVGRSSRYIFFEGTVLQSRHTFRYVLGFYWFDGQWIWICRWLNDDWQCCHLSAVLAGQ